MTEYNHTTDYYVIHHKDFSDISVLHDVLFLVFVYKLILSSLRVEGAFFTTLILIRMWIFYCFSFILINLNAFSLVSHFLYVRIFFHSTCDLSHDCTRKIVAQSQNIFHVIFLCDIGFRLDFYEGKKKIKCQ